MNNTSIPRNGNIVGFETQKGLTSAPFIRNNAVLYKAEGILGDCQGNILVVRSYLLISRYEMSVLFHPRMAKLTEKYITNKG